MLSQVALVALAALTLGSDALNITINPDEVAATTRSQWCEAQFNSCNQLCADAASTNLCTASTLDYSCICSDGTKPNLTEYTQTIPYFECEQAYADCNTANVGDSIGQANCTTSIQDQCGKIAPENATVSSTSTTSAASSATSATSTATGAATTTSASTGGAMPTSFQHLGNGAAAVAVGLFAYLL